MVLDNEGHPKIHLVSDGLQQLMANDSVHSGNGVTMTFTDL